MNHNYSIQKGESNPLGATLSDEGVNFCVFSPEAKCIELLLFSHEDDENPTVIALDSKKNKTFYYWHIFVEGLKKNQLYGYRVEGDLNTDRGRRFDSSKVLTDPYGKAIVGNYDRRLASEYGKCNLKVCLKSAVVENYFDWQGVYFPNNPQTTLVIYEMHVGGFTKHPSSKVSENKRGTFAGVIEKIPYLKSLGITAVELLPVFAFDEQDAPEGKTNYWGYSPINFFAPHPSFCESNEPQEMINEFKTMVRELHRAGIEVILDVVYNHTAEADYNGPTYNLRGFSNYSYYILDEKGENKDYSGCGNTLNANHSVVRRMIYNSLEYWVQEMHVDGFRFDLASILSRDEDGTPMYNPPVLWSIESNPILANTKLIAEPWDAAGLYQVSNFSGDRWAIWNANYRDDIRKFVKSNEGMVSVLASRILGSQDILKGRHHEFVPDRSIHFITCHDGFTLNDLVSYNEKHNIENGEDNRDGHNHNESWNCGVEGETDNTKIKKLRKKQIKNFLTILFLSQGTPMLLMGDEMRRTQRGNNNAYCQDNEISWLNWDDIEKNKEIVDFTKQIIAISKNYKLFNVEEYINSEKKEDRPYVIWHGQKSNQPDWSKESRSLACEFINPITKNHFFIIFNSFWEDLEFDLPKEYKWQRLIDTSLEVQTNSIVQNHIYKVCSRSVVVLKNGKNYDSN
ncbi:isoamylase 1, chloroplastic [Flavobacteriaceae bacterium UJ101]|nr:isoamylase 1, chloroplastic [Flavobacteriaceae bacterium UJ101]